MVGNKTRKRLLMPKGGHCNPISIDGANLPSTCRCVFIRNCVTCHKHVHSFDFMKLRKIEA